MNDEVTRHILRIVIGGFLPLLGASFVAALLASGLQRFFRAQDETLGYGLKLIAVVGIMAVLYPFLYQEFIALFTLTLTAGK